MAVPTIAAPTGGVSTYRQIPSKVHRRTGLLRPVYKRRTCRDGRPYVTIPFTIPGAQTTGDFGPADKLDRDYWIARVVAQLGRHNEATHPTGDGTAGGSDFICTIRRVDAADPSDDQNILNDDSRLRIQQGHHFDAVNDDEDGAFEDTDFNLHHLNENDQPYIRVLQVGSSRPGIGLVVSLVLVPIP